MGSGSWSMDSYAKYSHATRGVSLDSTGAMDTSMTNQEMFKARRLDEALNPLNVIRECCDSEEHPNTVPVILGLDVTGSMGESAVEVAKKLNVIMTDLYDKIEDVEFLIMGIGDLSYDDCPIQVSQFESDIRIAEQLDKIYFEFGGGGNYYESYTATWYFGSRHTKLDCWERGKKGIIITMGDERINPYLPHKALSKVTGDNLQGDIETEELYEEAKEKFDIYHLDVKHGRDWDYENIISSWKNYLDKNHFKTVTMDSISNTITDIIINSVSNSDNNSVAVNGSNEIVW